MKLILLTVAVLQCVVGQSDQYTDRYDSLDLDAVLANKRLTASYIRCVLDKGRCTMEGRELKSHIIEALKNGCAQCTNAQREGMRRVIKHLITYEKAYWQELVQKYDPHRVFTQMYEKELNSL